MKTKLFGLVLALCLLAGAFMGMTAFAEEEEILFAGADYTAWQWVGGTGEGGYWNLEGTSMQRGFAAEMDPEGVYRLTFDYATTAADTFFYIQRSINGSNFTPNVVLPATYAAEDEETFKTFTYTFIPGTDATGAPVTDNFRIYFSAPGASALRIKHNFETMETIKMVKLSGLDAITPSEEGETVQCITGGEQVTGDARVGAKMMKVTAGNAMTMEFTPFDALVKFRGFMKAQDFAEGDTVKVTFYQGAGDSVIAEKTYTYSATDENFKDIQNGVWEYFRFSGMPGQTAINVEFEVTSAAGFVYVDGVTMEADGNLFKDPRFVDAKEKDGADGSKWKILSGDASHLSVETDGNCPDGQNYMVITTDTVHGRDTYNDNGGISKLEVNTRYLLSFWYKATSACRVNPYVKYDGRTTVFENEALLLNGSAYSPTPDYLSGGPWMCYLNATNGEWKHVAMIVTTPTNVYEVAPAFPFVNGTMEVSNISIEKIDEKEIRFFVPDLTGTFTDPMTGVHIAYSTYLGKPVEVQEDIKAGEKVKATCLVPVLNENKQALSTDKVVLAAYNEAGTLIGIKVGAQATLGADASDVAGVPFGTDNANDGALAKADGTPLKLVNYPSAILESSAFADAASIRAFCWDAASGFSLKPMLDAVALN